MSELFVSLPANQLGRDFVVGDVHGCFTELHALLEQVVFDGSRDRLFSVGDLVDRGPESRQVLEWLAKPWFHAVRGNHEQMALDFDLADTDACERYLHNGGGWFICLDELDKQAYRAAFSRLPLAMELPSPHGLIGLLHADCPQDDWNALREQLSLTQPWGEEGGRLLRQIIWCRLRARGTPRQPVRGLFMLCVGHTPQREVRSIDNVRYLDTGGVYGRSLSMLQLDTLQIHSIGVTDKGYSSTELDG
ncbi:serine/threonine protein phosphatase [Aquitalea palustris]|uniref:Serine/threonine protein phosphatase n=1 Tax=Aquitalea palustris TaxID=2480983 RepID=A0A454JJW6_9NEIS|nr:metallophosphoesterase [Aquitalea palustris]RMC99511.1 serine/threonine protein phosphatase [Aquitalea palustris]